MKSAVILIPTTGASDVRGAIQSCLDQTYPQVRVLAVVDGPEHHDAFVRHTAGLDAARLQSVTLSQNVGREGYYGHRIYAAFSHLVDDDYVLFLDQDNRVASDHVARLVDTIESGRLDWSYALRRICDREGAFLFQDDCESLGKWPSLEGHTLVDTNCYCLTRATAVRMAGAWHGGWGQDRVFTAAIMKTFPRYGCSGAYTVDYRLQQDWQRTVFEANNARMLARYPNGFPWNRSVSP